MAMQLGETEKELIEIRKNKINEIRNKNLDPYPSVSNRDFLAKAVIDNKDDLIAQNKTVTVAGRVMARRGHGQMCFIDLVDESGKIQIVLKSDLVGSDFEVLSLVDLGDFVEASGRVFTTNAGEISIQAENFRILTKSIRPLPDKHSGLKDTETRYRERYADLIVNAEVKDIFYKRSQIVSSIRSFLVENGFMEVDTPILQPIPGGATAKPFSSYYNAYDREVFLRIAPELYLKRLLVGGFEKIFEFARCFRNEGVDASHNPEFTNLEFYWAYSNYEQLMDFTEELLRRVVSDINNGSLILDINGQQIDFSKKFARITFSELTGGTESDEAFKAGVEKIIQPTFVTNHPTALIPLAKRNKDNPDVVDSFQFILCGVELLKAFSELNDPVDQRNRFEDQMKMREAGDEEAQLLDEDFLKAIEYGMPPTAGWGMGIDRLAKVLTGSKTLREVMFFPFMKPEQQKKENNNQENNK